MLKAAKAYLNTQVTTATKGDLLLMLYDTAIKHLKLAQVKINEKDFAAKGILITKALDIIGELQSCLNKERGGDVAQNLFRLYYFCNTRLLQANMSMDVAMVEDVIGILGGLRQAFAQIISTQENTTSPAQTPFMDAGTPPLQAQAQAAQVQAMQAQAMQAQAMQVQAASPQEAVAQAPGAEAPAPVEAEVAASVAPQSEAPQPEPAQPVQTIRYRAANAYANSR